VAEAVESAGPRARVFGGLQVEGLTASELGSRKARTLLAVLALSRGAPVGIDRLASVLWGDEPPARPADQLGVLVSRLRRVLGPARIRRLGDGYALDLDWLDLAEFEERAADAQARLRAGAAGAALASARSALALATAEPLGDEPGEWAELERRRVERLRADLALVAGEAALAVGEPLAAAGTAESALARDPYDEAALRLLMRAQVAAGRPGSALAAYARVRSSLAEDLGTSPAEETEALHTRVLRGLEHPPAPVSPASALAEGGTFLLVEPMAGEDLHANLYPVGRMFYSVAPFICTANARAQHGPHELGNQVPDEVWRRLLAQAGFGRFRRAAETPFNRIFEARP
jgi:DNA-binding SARP family transcriptional activator